MPATLAAVDASLDIAVLELQEQQAGLIPIQVGLGNKKPAILCAAGHSRSRRATCA